MSDSENKIHYTESFNTALQWIWGDGYLSPGGAEEVAEMLRDISVRDRAILDIGSGLGAIDILLAETHGARSVLGIDVEPQLIEHASRRAAAADLAQRVRFQLVEPGPLPFTDGSFDIVFSKDAIIHIADKSAFYAEVLRVLEPGGVFIGSDWLCGDKETHTEQALAWLEFIDLNFAMKNLVETRQALEQAGFEQVRLKDRNEWYRTEIKNELASLAGDNYAKLVRLVGAEQAAHRLKSSTLKQQAIEDGFLRPTHFVGYKPAAR